MPGATPRSGVAAHAPSIARRKSSVPPVLVRQVRNGIVESEHRGSVVEVDVDGRILNAVGDPDRVVTLRSSAKPFGAIALVESGAIEAFSISSDELALVTSSHSGEDIHVRTLQGLLRRAKVPQSSLGCGATGAPLDLLTAARLARDGERPSPMRHMCSGQHSVFLLLARLNGWPIERYWEDGHPAMAALRGVIARAFGVAERELVTAIDGCGIPTFAFPLREVARAYALLADPTGVRASDPRAALAPALSRIRDAMLAHPDLVAGTHDRLDTSLMKAAPGRLVSKGGMEALLGVGILPAEQGGTASRGAAGAGTRAASGLALKIEDGDGLKRAVAAAAVESLGQIGVLDGPALRALGRYHRPPTLDPHGRVAAEAIADFELAPLGELFA